MEREERESIAVDFLKDIPGITGVHMNNYGQKYRAETQREAVYKTVSYSSFNFEQLLLFRRRDSLRNL